MSANINATPLGSRLFYWVGFALIATLAWRALVPAHEWPSPNVTYMTMLFDAGMLAGLVGSYAKGRFEGAGAHALFWLGLLSGIGLFIIRMTSSPAWSSGHIVNTLS